MKKGSSEITEKDIKIAIKYLETQGKVATREEALKLLQGMKITAHLIAHKKVEEEKEKKDK